MGILKNFVKPYLKIIFPGFCGQRLRLKDHLRLTLKFIDDYSKFKAIENKSLHLIKFDNICPRIYESEPSTQSGGGEYFQQDIWTLTKINNNLPEKHYDIGSRIDGFSAQCSAMVPVEFLDVRYIDYNLPNMTVVEGDLLNLHYEDNSIKSLSCLHTLEHVGLGRYGDPIDVYGMEKGLQELIRVLSAGGNLYVSFPIGPKSFIEFNAHRITNPKEIYEKYMSDLELIEFSVAKDNNLYRSITFEDFVAMNVVGIGLFHLRKKM